MNADALWVRIVCVAAAGAVGALARWGVSRGSHLLLGSAWPYGTLAVNVVGCFFFGLVWSWLRSQPPNDLLRLTLLTGFAGAFTTFSTFAFDTYELAAGRGELQGLSLLQPALNIAAHLVLGMLAIIAGLSLGRVAT
ncbi:MAG: CrcB family protein [Pirellulales bacterium]|nr:CrcB family protein [Pirellulales bacterium]